LIRRALFVVLALFGLAVAPSDAATPPQKAIEAFIRAATSSKPSAAYEMLTEATRGRLGEPQFSAYMHVRRELLGKLLSVGAAKRAPEEDVAGVTFYAVDLEFERGTVPGFVAFPNEGADGRVARFSVALPKGSEPKVDDADYLLVMTDFVNVIAKHGLASLADRLSTDTLEKSGKSRDDVHAMFADFDELLGAMTHYEIDAALTHDGSCRTVPLEGNFDHGQAAVTLRLCMSDGLWQLAAADVTPTLTPSLAAHQLQKAMTQKIGSEVRVTCPLDAPFPVGGDIVCRVDARGEVLDATIRRTTKSGVNVVDVKKR
jgi:hypothetical protein